MMHEKMEVASLILQINSCESYEISTPEGCKLLQTLTKLLGFRELESSAWGNGTFLSTNYKDLSRTLSYYYAWYLE